MGKGGGEGNVRKKSPGGASTSVDTSEQVNIRQTVIMGHDGLPQIYRYGIDNNTAVNESIPLAKNLSSLTPKNIDLLRHLLCRGLHLGEVASFKKQDEPKTFLQKLDKELAGKYKDSLLHRLLKFRILTEGYHYTEIKQPPPTTFDSDDLRNTTIKEMRRVLPNTEAAINFIKSLNEPNRYEIIMLGKRMYWDLGGDTDSKLWCKNNISDYERLDHFRQQAVEKDAETIIGNRYFGSAAHSYKQWVADNLSLDNMVWDACSPSEKNIAFLKFMERNSHSVNMGDYFSSFFWGNVTKCLPLNEAQLDIEREGSVSSIIGKSRHVEAEKQCKTEHTDWKEKTEADKQILIDAKKGELAQGRRNKAKEDLQNIASNDIAEAHFQLGLIYLSEEGFENAGANLYQAFDLGHPCAGLYLIQELPADKMSEHMVAPSSIGALSYLIQTMQRLNLYDTILNGVYEKEPQNHELLPNLILNGWSKSTIANARFELHRHFKKLIDGNPLIKMQRYLAAARMRLDVDDKKVTLMQERFNDLLSAIERKSESEINTYLVTPVPRPQAPVTWSYNACPGLTANIARCFMPERHYQDPEGLEGLLAELNEIQNNPASERNLEQVVESYREYQKLDTASRRNQGKADKQDAWRYSFPTKYARTRYCFGASLAEIEKMQNDSSLTNLTLIEQIEFALHSCQIISPETHINNRASQAISVEGIENDLAPWHEIRNFLGNLEKPEDTEIARLLNRFVLRVKKYINAKQQEIAKSSLEEAKETARLINA